MKLGFSVLSAVMLLTSQALAEAPAVPAPNGSAAAAVPIGAPNPATTAITKLRPPEPAPGAPPVRVAVASVTLGRDCADHAAAPKPSAGARPADAPTDSLRLAKSDSQAAPVSSSKAKWAVQPCVQTAVVLQITSKAKSPIVVGLNKVTLTDAKGNVVGDMMPMRSSKWDKNGYVEWDRNLLAGKSVKVNWELTTPAGIVNPGLQGNSKQYRVVVEFAVDQQVGTAKGKVTRVVVSAPPSPPVFRDPMVKT